MNELKYRGKMSIMLAAMMLGFGFAACKKDSTGEETHARTLVKSKLYDKKWWNEGSTISLKFHSDGNFFDGIGTWEWINDSDSVLIKYNFSTNRIWIIEWTDDHEMSARIKGNSSRLFKDVKW